MPGTMALPGTLPAQQEDGASRPRSDMSLRSCVDFNVGIFFHVLFSHLIPCILIPSCGPLDRLSVTWLAIVIELDRDLSSLTHFTRRALCPRRP